MHLAVMSRAKYYKEVLPISAEITSTSATKSCETTSCFDANDEEKWWVSKVTVIVNKLTVVAIKMQQAYLMTKLFLRDSWNNNKSKITGPVIGLICFLDEKIEEKVFTVQRWSQDQEILGLHSDLDSSNYICVC